VADRETGVFLADPDAGAFDHHDDHFQISGRFNVPRSPQGRPVIFQAGDSEEGREFAAESADAIFTRHSGYSSGRSFYADIKGRLARYGRSPDDLVVLPATTFVLADTDADADELSRHVRSQQVSGATAIKLLEHVWNRDLSAYDPDGPLPDVDPDLQSETIAPGRASVRMVKDSAGTARQWRELAERKGLSIRQLMIEVSARQSFVGSPTTIADSMEKFVTDQACDGFILVPHLVPGGLDDFADRVVPLLQERGAFRTEYQGTTLRDHLGLRALGDRRPRAVSGGARASASAMATASASASEAP
jgi:alkanesulfonate monooxygenase SsuD/methylene tetrahydromethanopterin reductase-like flavin-dependent oxidoreductase (luciferase family)